VERKLGQFVEGKGSLDDPVSGLDAETGVDMDGGVEATILTEEGEGVGLEACVEDGALDPEPEVPRGTPAARRKYANRFASVEPHHSLGNPGHGSLQL
jgi:hypothetical protein